MKKINALAGVILACSVQGTAQVGGYTFSKLTAAYTELPASKQIITTAWMNGFNNIVITAPIEIIMFNQPTDATEFRVTHQGQIIYEPTLTASNFVISAHGGDLYGVANSQAAEISYVKEGTYPNSILKVQYKNAGFYVESPRTSFVNFQIWVYEANDVIEFRYGPRTVNPSSAVPGDIGLFNEEVGTSLASIELFGSSANPTPNAGTLVDGSHLADHPAANTVYRFAPVTTSISSAAVLTAGTRVGYDVDARNVVVVMESEPAVGALIEIFNVAGQKVAEHLVEGRTTLIPFSAYPAGLYVIKTKTRDSVVSHKISVQ